MMRVRALRESPTGSLSQPTRCLPVRFWWLAFGFVLGVLLTGVAQAMPPQLFKPEWFLPLERLAPATAQRTVLPSSPVDVSGVRYVRDGREWRLDDFLTRGQVKSLLVVHDGKIVHEVHQWPHGPSTRHQSWSVMKQVLSMLVGRALQRGQIRSLDDPMDRYLPSLAKNGFAGVTFRQALLMSSGVRYVEDVDRIGSSSFRVEPNSHNDSWSSSPVGMCAGRWPACAHVHRAGLSRRMSPWALP
ncbi:MAG: serine hydrolase [Aquabacterium sp.]